MTTDKKFLPCIPAAACTGNLEYQCKIGYTGVRCGECTDGYYRLNGTCKKCNSDVPDWFVPLVVIFGFVCIVMLFALMKRGPTRGLVNIVVNFIQTVAVFEQFFVSLDFSPALKQTFELLGGAHLNLELASPECVLSKYQFGPKFDLRYKLQFTLLLPLFIAAAIAPVAIFNSYPAIWLYRRLRDLVLRTSSEIDSRALKARQKDMFLLTVQTFNMILNIIYIVLVSQSLTIFDCTKQADGQYYLDAQPNALCFNDWWYEYASLGAVGVAIYVVGIPLYFMIMLGILYQSTFYGKLWVRAKEWTFMILDIESSYFKSTHQHFLVIQFVRKLFIVVIKMNLTKYPVMQAVLTTCILCVDLLLSAKYLPYSIKSLNILEVVCTMSAIVVMNCGLLIHTNQFETETQRDAVAVIILIVIFTCISITIGIFLLEVKTKIQNQIMKGLTGQKDLDFDENAWMSKQIGADTAPTKLQKTSFLRNALATIGGQGKTAMLNTQPMESPVEVSRAPSTKRHLEGTRNSNGSGMI
ncbi:hypothetical protein BKA69DRAFT_154614 [Paraphysoderma sedebokerense]|nr:hypothetical protein BKA69DRAFT_1179160 [Paraphysoderma sedebokerense]KAI9143145.1 hypothetical protein BKA69DRAFT_154614 [Paraphysoderma sedebokerense]